MDYNDTTNKSGLLQTFEYWAGLNDGDTGDDATLKAIATSLFNRRLERYLGLLGAGSSLSKIDDTNYTNQSFSYFDIVITQADYEFLEDEDGNSISDITSVMILDNSLYKAITKITLDDADADIIVSPNSDTTGVPNRYIERNNTIFLDPVPDYGLVKGGKIFYKRCPSYFVVTDTDKEPGIPFQFHQMIAIGAAFDWIVVNKPNYQALIVTVRDELNKWEKELKTYVELRNPSRRNLTPKMENTR